MFRLLIVSCFFSLTLVSAGCRLCPTPHNCRVSTFLDRHDDYRGTNPLYRAGSILGGDWCNPVVIGNAFYEGSTGEVYSNAGNYGVTMPVTPVRRDDGTRSGAIAIPLSTPGHSGELRDGSLIPSLPELMDRHRETTPVPDFQQRPIVEPPPFEGMSPDATPFSPSDEINEPIFPLGIVPPILDTEQPITLEELRRLDPSIRDLQIISIEDAAVGMLVR